MGPGILSHNDPGVHKQAGEQFSPRVGELGAERDGIGIPIHVYSREVQMADR